MDPQSQAFTPYSNNDTWRLQTDVARIQQVQTEHSDRIARLERRQEEDARVKSVWGNQSTFPSVLSGGAGGTPNQGMLPRFFLEAVKDGFELASSCCSRSIYAVRILTFAAPLSSLPSDHYRTSDEETNSLMNSLNLDAEDEPRRGNGATSRANSVRFDETANQNHFSHSSRPSVEFMSRTSSGGLGGLQLNERTSSHKSEGRASSAHSMRSATSGRTSLNLETGHGLNDSRASPMEPPGLAPGLFLLGSVPAIIRCWMNMNFKHDALLYAAVCTGSHKSSLDVRLIRKLGYEDIIRPAENGVRTIRLSVFFPEAVPHPASSRSSSPAPQLPTLTMEFQVIESSASDDERPIQIFMGSDVLRAHSADILFSSNTMTMFDDDRSKLSIPLVRPENEAAFKSLYITSRTAATMQKQEEKISEPLPLNGLGQASSTASIASSTTSPKPTIRYRPPGVVAAESSSTDSAKAGAGTGSDSDARPASRQSTASRPSLNLGTARSELSDSTAQPTETGSSTTPSRTGSSSAIWGSSWRRDTGSSATPSTALPTPTSGGGALDWASASRSTREPAYQRRDTGMKVLKPKTAARTFATTPATVTSETASPAEGKSRFFDEGRRKSEVGGEAASGNGSIKKDAEPSTPTAEQSVKTKGNPIGRATAFSWMNSSK